MTIADTPGTGRRRTRTALLPGEDGTFRPGPDGFPYPLTSWEDLPVTVQLLPDHLRAGEHAPWRVGEVVEAAPAVYLADHTPVLVGADRWRTTEHGGLFARGTVLPPPPSLRPCDPQYPHVLEVAGRAFPLNWAASGPGGPGRVDVEGGLYLDPELAPGTEYGEAVGVCQRRWRVTSLRRYRRTRGEPKRPVLLRSVPRPREVDDAAVYVADLAPVADRLDR